MTCRSSRCARRAVFAALLVVGVTGAGSVASAWAAPGAGWEATAHALPTNLPPGGSGLIAVDVFNVGAADSTGTVTVTDVLPPGVTATDSGAFSDSAISHQPQLWDCAGVTVVTCTNDPVNLATFPGGAGVPSSIGDTQTPPIGIAVKLATNLSGTVVNHVSVAGGGAQSAAATADPITVSPAPAGFGIVTWDAWFSDEDGTIDTQAGSHPYSATFAVEMNSEEESCGEDCKNYTPAGGQLRNVTVELPPGFVGNPTAVPQCPREDFDGGPSLVVHCPPDTQIGVVSSLYGGQLHDEEPVFNLVPPPGVAAKFGFSFVGNSVFLDSSPRTGSDYGIDTRTDNVPEGRDTLGAVVSLWGVPGDPSHNAWRCFNAGGCSSGAGTSPFLTLPTSCTGSQPQLRLHVSEWENPDVTDESTVPVHDANGEATGFTGCEKLGFNPAITIAPDTTKADTPTGLTVEVKPPVGGLTAQGGLSTSDLQNTTVKLPEGLVINPGQAAGLQACQAAQDAVGSEAAPSCPPASKVGEDEIETPLLAHSLKGNVYILQSNPPNLELLVAASGEGVNLKLVGKVHLNGTTGQLETKFEGTPELPFTNFRLSFSGGAQAALATPTGCGTYATSADFDPWSSPFTADLLTSADFAITSGPDGGPCPSSPLPFSPSLTAGATTDQAGGFTAFSLLLQTADAQQRISRLQFKAPAGLSGMISKVPLCQEPQAAAGKCPAVSQIGHTVVASGPGPYPLVVPQPGQPPAAIYLTGPYQGAPFGLSIVVPVVAGPFTLETQIVRARIDVDPVTAQITVTTDPLPQIIDGVPTDLRTVDAVIDREGFMFNPTDCNPKAFSGTATSAQGGSAPLASHFQVGSCQSLKFAPKFAVSTSGRTSKADGASLIAKLAYQVAAQGTQANITRVKVDLPKQLPSRLTTLQKACTSAQFEANPAGCPAESIIGEATVSTPLLPVPLTGPAYFVSHGGEAFPSLIMVLQGYGVTVDLVGTTFISKAGITSSTFKTVPDVPFSTFTLTLPQGRYSALAANGNLCTSKLAMPTEFLAQNGLKINESTKISVSGCAKKKVLTRAQKLIAALKACQRKPKKQRAGCETTVRHRDGPVRAKKRKK
jgi:hypothetical protein